MTRRLLLAAPFVAAVLVYAAATVPLRARAAQARDAYAQARRERQQAQARVAPLERREAARRQATAALARVGDADGGPVAAVRRAVLATAERTGAARLRLAVRPAAGAVGVRLAATAPYERAVRLPGDVAGPETGLVLQRVRLERKANERLIAVDVEAAAPIRAP